MVDAFHRHIRQALADSNLQSALDANADRRIQVRKTAFASLPNPQSARQRAHSIRADVIEHLDSYLRKFKSKAERNGFHVHQAADADEAVRLVLDIANQHAARKIAKSKTMVSEEIGLNHALEAQGLQVVETDLGEYIVQLRGETPSHIITPAVHLRRQDVGRLFHEKLGLPYTEDISIMTNAARQQLRQVFLQADIGISGVNFAVVDTGTLCLVTNEGNGRMVTTLPPVHIALMGIERLVPSLDDLCVMLSLLPRSATGQKLSVYTSFINGPRHPDDPDGPQERHVILVDNGRSMVQASDLREILYCIRCGSCLNACPVFREIGGHAYVSRNGKGSPYPGPIGSVISPALFGWLEYGHLARASSLCGACREACPVDIDLPGLLLRVRAGVQAAHAQPDPKPNAPPVLSAGLKLFTLAAGTPARFAAAQRLAAFFGSIAAGFSKHDPWMHLPKFTGWGFSKDFPRPSARPFRSRFKRVTRGSSAPPGSISIQSQKPVVDAYENSLGPSAVVSGIDIFASELQAVGGIFMACPAGEAAGKVLEILQVHGMHELLVWEASALPPGLFDRLSASGILISHPDRSTRAASSLVKAGITGASAAIANTGSLLLLGGPGRPLTASLLPEIHIVMLKKKDIVEDLDQALKHVDLGRAAAAVLITGPSRTADIEMTLTIGVHGPGELYVICL